MEGEREGWRERERDGGKEGERDGGRERDVKEVTWSRQTEDCQPR